MSVARSIELSATGNGKALAAALDALDRGELVVVPTETVYGLAAREDRPAAVERLRRLKAGRDKPFSLAVPALDMLADRLEPALPSATRIMQRWWPGPVTLLLAQRRGARVGVRVPGHAWTRELIAAAGVPLLLPSANLPDEPPPMDVASVSGAVRDRIALLVDGGRTALGEASTVVEPLPGGLRLLREGVVSRADLWRHARPLVLVVCSGNTCRSPMASLLLQRALEQRCADDPALVPARVCSAGLHMTSDKPATEEAVAALAELGLDLAEHVSRSLQAAELERADSVLCMTAAHVDAVLARAHRDVAPRVRLFDPEAADIEDPFGGALAEYRSVARRLQQMSGAWAMRLLPVEEHAG